MSKKAPSPIHPGEILREEFLVPLGMSPYALSVALYVPRTRIERLVREETALTADTALRLARYFDMSVEFWLGLQSQFEIDTAKGTSDTSITRIKPRKVA